MGKNEYIYQYPAYWVYKEALEESSDRRDARMTSPYYYIVPRVRAIPTHCCI